VLPQFARPPCSGSAPWIGDIPARALVPSFRHVQLPEQPVDLGVERVKLGGSRESPQVVFPEVPRLEGSGRVVDQDLDGRGEQDLPAVPGGP